MKAVMITEPGPPGVLRIGKVSDPVPADGELLIQVRASSLNRADLLQRRGIYPPPAGTREDIPGLEYAGTVIESREPECPFKPGDRVMGLLPGAGYAERVVTPAITAMPVPHQLSFEEAAAIPEVFATAYDALFRQVGLKQGERLLIHAVGSGVGTAAVQLSREAGVAMFGTSGSNEKLVRAKELGLDTGINYHIEDFAEKILKQTEDAGVDAILDLVGAAHWKGNLKVLRSTGRMIIIGLVSGSKVEADLSVILRKRLRLMGSVLRFRTLAEKKQLTHLIIENVLPLFEAGRLAPVIDRVYPWHEVVAAHSYMEENRNFGKIVLSGEW
jgi:putative PIG3 family NAD(P)H quinone oxidoreductase